MSDQDTQRYHDYQGPMRVIADLPGLLRICQFPGKSPPMLDPVPKTPPPSNRQPRPYGTPYIPVNQDSTRGIADLPRHRRISRFPGKSPKMLDPLPKTPPPSNKLPRPQDK